MGLFVKSAKNTAVVTVSEENAERMSQMVAAAQALLLDVAAFLEKNPDCGAYVMMAVVKHRQNLMSGNFGPIIADIKADKVLGRYLK